MLCLLLTPNKPQVSLTGATDWLPKLELKFLLQYQPLPNGKKRFNLERLRVNRIRRESEGQLWGFTGGTACLAWPSTERKGRAQVPRTATGRQCLLCLCYSKGASPLPPLADKTLLLARLQRRPRRKQPLPPVRLRTLALKFSIFGKWVREGQEFKAIFAYKLSWRSA